MAKRDPNQTARNRIIQNIKVELRRLLPTVLYETGLSSEASLNAKIGEKNDKFFDLKHDVIRSCDEFVNRWLQGLLGVINSRDSDSYNFLFDNLRQSKNFKKYLLLFLRRSYLKHFEELSKNRPRVEESIIWIGQNNASYGLPISARFVNGQWENDKSEIRAFKQGYWTIGHVMETGLVIPDIDDIMEFPSIDHYLKFLKNTLVRNSGSKYEYKIAQLYCEYVEKQVDPSSVPLMIPEYRYNGLDKNHKYRLDFLIINPFTLDKRGFELSPWSSHGYLRKTKGLTQKEINEMAKDNFQKEMRKHKAFFKDRNIFTLIYTDEDLSNCNCLFNNDIAPCLAPENPYPEYSFQIMEDFGF